LIGTLVALGWTLGIFQLVQIHQSWPRMAPSTAIGLVLIAIALATTVKGFPNNRIRSAVLISLVCVGLICVLTLGEYLSGWGMSPDRWFLGFDVHTSVDGAVGFMAPNTALALLLITGAVSLLDAQTESVRRSAQYMAWAVFVIALNAVLGFGYGTASQYIFLNRPGMAIHTGCALILLSIGIVCARPNLRLVQMITSDTSGSLLARRLSLAAVVVPVFLGLVAILGERAGYYDGAFAASLLVATSILVFLVVIWRNADSLYHLDLKRQQAEQLLRDAHDELEKRVESRTAELATSNEELRREVLERQRAECELRRSQQDLTDFFENAPIGLNLIGPDGRILRANHAQLDLLGYTREEYVEHQILEFHADPEGCAGLLDRLRNGETIIGDEVKLRAKDGSIRDARIDANVMSEDGRFVHIRWFTRDITARKRAEEESKAHLAREQAARAQAEESAALVRRLQMIIDISLMHLPLDELLSEMLGRTRDLLRADGAAVLLLTDDRERLTVCATTGVDNANAPELCSETSVAARVATTRSPVVVDDLSSAGDLQGHLLSKIRSLVSAPLMVEGDVLGVIQVFTFEVRPFSDNDLRLLQLVADRVALAVEQARLYETEQSARKQAEAASRMKDEFLATVSHELRSPLNAILGWVKLLREGKLEADSAEHALETVERSARAQSSIINDLLDVSRIITGKIRLNVQRIDPARLIESAIESVRPAAEAKEIQLDIVLDPNTGPIACDPDRLRQLVWNLVSNAIKFTPNEGRVKVELGRSDRDIELRVSDNGAGIDNTFLPYVFDRFRQADGSSTRRHGGLGLGLAIVRHLVELHGGTVEVESEGVGLGSTFTVKLPRVTSSLSSDLDFLHIVSQSMPPLEQAPSLEGVRILIVDDDADARDLLRALLVQSHAEIKTAESTAKALEVLGHWDEWQPDVLVSDIEMPDSDGINLIRQVRSLETERGGRLPAVAVTAYARIEDRTRILAAGFQMHVSKPVETAELVTAVAALTGKLGEPIEESRTFSCSK
jgi:PAS domain S-box-containing protein